MVLKLKLIIHLWVIWSESQRVFPLAVHVALGKLFRSLKPIEKGITIAILTELLFREKNVCRAVEYDRCSASGGDRSLPCRLAILIM